MATPLKPGPTEESSASNKGGRTHRQRIYEVIFEHDTGVGRLFDVSLIVLILVSLVAVMLETVEPIAAEHGRTLRTLEYVLTGFFTLEYAIRLYSHPHPKVYARSFFGVIDLISILPTWIGLFIPGAQTFAVFRALRIVRVFRVLKLGRFVSEGEVLRQAVIASVPKIVVFLVTILCTVTICGSAMYLIEGPESQFTSIPRGVYWAIVTLTTVGFGDVTPTSTPGQVVASFIMVMGYGIIAVPTGIVSAELARAPKPVSGQCCSGCGSEDHDTDAEFCKRCGTSLDE